MATETAKISRASIKNLNIAPRKVKLVTDLVKGRNVNDALAQLQMTNKRSSHPIAKLVKSAVANAREKGMDASKLVIEDVTVNKGRVLKRGLSRGRGRVTLVEKKNSHVELIVREVEEALPTEFVIHEKPKVEKTRRQAKAPRDEKPKYEREDEKPKKKDKKPGFINKFFRRKSI